MVRRRVARAVAAQPRRGMTLIEIMVALSILAASLLGAGMFFVAFSRANADAAIRTTAGQLAADRLEQIKSATSYSAIDSLYAFDETPVTGYPKFQRSTKVAHVGGGPADSLDIRVITVTVTSTVKPVSVKKTTVISDF